MGKKSKTGKVRISGDEYERLIAQYYYEKYKDEAVIEPNLFFFEELTPNTVDFKAEFDLFANFKNGSTHLVECKARPIETYDINRFHLQAKSTGYLNSYCRILSIYDIDENIKQNALDLGIEIKVKKLNEIARKSGMSVREYVNFKINEREMFTYYKYNNAALNEFSGYYILLNNCWITHYSERKEIIDLIKDAMKLSIPHTHGEERKIMEFIFIKACLLENWLINNDKSILTQDIIKLILNKSYSDKNRHENLQYFLTKIKNELGSKIFLTLDKTLKYKKYEAKFIEYKKEPEKFSNLYLIMGFDTYIFPSLSTLIDKMWNLYHFENLYLLHTGAKASIDATYRFKDKFLINNRIFTENLCECHPPFDYSTNQKKPFDITDFFDFILSKANQDSALLITYIPKDWALYFHSEKRKWKYFFFINRPEFSPQWEQSNNISSRELSLKAYELNYI